MTIHRLPVGVLQTNCYIVSTKQKNALVIDPGAGPEGILSFLEKEGLTPRLLVFTHGHFDHIGGASRLQEATGAQTAVPAGDEDIFLDPALGGSGIFDSFDGYTPNKPDRLYRDGDVITLDEISLTALHTPGHSKGSSVLYGDGVLFSGDTLFAGSCGRTDLYGGDEKAILDSLRRIAGLPGDWQVLPGHGPETSLAVERVSNPFMGTNYDDIF